MDYADDAKLKLLDWLVKYLHADEMVGSEVQFSEGRQRADLIVASTKRLCAIEIKGPKDDLRRLQRQLNGYQNMFLEVFVATHQKYLTIIRTLIPKEIGLILILDNSLTVYRKAKAHNLLSKDGALSWLRTEDLKAIMRMYNIKPKQSTITELRSTTKQLLSQKELSKAALVSVIDRLRFRFEAFQNERGKVVTLDDLKMLQVPDTIS